MRQRLSLGIRKLRGKATLQLKFSLSYILVIAAVLILLNSYPLLVSQNMMVASNQNNLKSTAKVIESAMIGLEKLTVENVQAALEGLDESGAARIMVTNSAGLVLYDTRQGSNAVGAIRAVLRGGGGPARTGRQLLQLRRHGVFEPRGHACGVSQPDRGRGVRL